MRFRIRRAVALVRHFGHERQRPDTSAIQMTPEERRWWEIERLHEMKRLRLSSALPLSAMMIASMLLYQGSWHTVGGWAHALFVGVPTGFAMAWMQWRLGEGAARVKAVRGRRLREALLTGGFEGDEPPRSVGEFAGREARVSGEGSP